ncbi:MAG: Hpt domain-containing protein [Gemmatimonadota bacterium]|nr:MAG: Hpt domain-containing protein [Gemmatimonadota bacterium]
MSTPSPDELRGADELLEEIRREFRAGLPDRLEKMRSALEELARGYDQRAAEGFYRAAHSLKGAAPSFGAHELVEPAATLAELGLRWYEGGAVAAGEVAAALQVLERLKAEMQRFVSRMEGGAAV